VPEAAVALARSAPYFPEGAIHVVVVGAEAVHRPIAALIDAQRFVGPDNGLITLLFRRAQSEGRPVEVVHLDQPRFWRPEANRAWAGRDIFAPVAAHLAAGTFFTAVGSPIKDPALLPLGLPEKTPQGLRGEVMHIDPAGNLATNIRASDLAGLGEVRFRVGRAEVRGLASAPGAAGELVALVNQHNELEFSIGGGSAAGRLQVKIGEAVEVTRR